MNFVLSNAKMQNSISEYDTRVLIDKAVSYGITQVECNVGCEKLLSLEGLNGEYELEKFKKTLSDAGVRLYGFCLYTDFNMFTDIMLAKKCINLLKKLAAVNLRLILKPVPQEDISDSMYECIIRFLNSLSRFASYSAGGGGVQETTVKISFDMLTQKGLGFKDILRINTSIQQSRNAGVALDFCTVYGREAFRDILEHINGYELTANHLSIPADADANEAGQFVKAAGAAYDGPVCIDLQDGENKDLCDLMEKSREYAFDVRTIDYTKVSYPSSVARFFRSYGSASVNPDRNITAGDAGTWICTYTAGKQGIAENGGIRLAFHHSTDWQVFQLDKPAMEGYVSVRTIPGVVLSKQLLFIDACWYICVKVQQGHLAQGDEVVFTIGDRSGGSTGSKAQTFQQREFKFFMQVDATGNGIYFEHPNPPTVAISGGCAKKMTVIAPSVVRENESFNVGVRIEDRYHNTATGYSSRLRMKMQDESAIIGAGEIRNGDMAVLHFGNISIRKAGIYRIEVEDDNGLTGVSNCIKCTVDAGEYKVYWGDIHAHLGYMDSVGIVPEFYDYAKNISFLDFTCHSEHMDSYSGGRQASNSLQWEIVKEGARKYNEPGKFVTLLGYENSEIWDANVYFPGDDAPWHVDSFANCLFDFAAKHGAMVVPHMTTYPQRVRGYDWNNYNEKVMPVAEIYSCHGSSEYFGGEKPLKDCEPGGYIVDALNRGHKLGFIASGDGHDCMPGNAMLMENTCMNGLVAVYVKELTREAIFDAIMKRRCYAASNSRILAYFSIDGAMSGSEIEAEQGKTLSIRFSFYGTGDIEKADIVKNGAIIYTKSGDGNVLEDTFEDLAQKTGHNYYYVRMKQKDGAMAWISPIFINVRSNS